MENENSQPIQQDSIPPSTNWSKIILLSLLGLIFMVGLIFIGIQIGKKQITRTKLKTKRPAITTQTVTIPTASNEKVSLSVNGQLLGKLAFIRNDNLWLLDNGVEKQLTTDAKSTEIPYQTGLPSLWYSNPQISPNGSKIAFLKNTNTTVRTLVVSDIDGKNVKDLATDVEWTMPLIQWSKDSQQIYYPSSGGMDLIIAISVNIETGKKQEHGQFVLRSGCGGGSSDPADHVSAAENISSVGGGIQVFSLSPQNDYIVHTILCTGSGLGLLDLSTKQDKTIDDKAMRAVISPDGKGIAAITGKNVVIFDMAGNVQKTFPTSDNPQVLLWNADGKTVYYSSSKLLKNLDFEDKLALDIVGSSPASYRVNTSTLWKLSLDSGKDSRILDFEAHGIKPVFITNQKLLVIVVENATTLFDYINQQRTINNIAKYYPKVKLIEVDLSALSSITVKSEVQQSSFLP